MKKIAQKTDGSGAVIVEMSRAEMEQFENLSTAVEGKAYPDSLPNDFGSRMDVDLASVFSVIRAWYNMKFSINQFTRILDDLSEVVWQRGDKKQ